ncbi:hypothetical protein [Candidatus Cardinium hertigii]|uniref:Uncharacterized protein n=1 Tax=Candidatus Cardinium hertigii TaxID=247481 RepID=A0A2Z3LI84_9BACT|nr:hypothetical protein [Candidatus Cardinium hertigii]AWN81770.1 hypothetical protein DK880_00444 [Candidatus Cardinium hertigii]
MVGHFILSFILFLCGLYSDRAEIIIFCWVLASPFAGTIFDIDTMFGKKYGRKTVRYAEAMGHVWGSIVGMVLFSLLKDIKYIMYASALIAHALQIKKYIIKKRNI